jgi:hypothetical protein
MARRELTLNDIGDMSRADIDAWNEARDQEIAGEAKAKREADDLERFTATFVAAGGHPGDANAAWQAERSRNAAETATREAESRMHADLRRRAQVL